MWYLATSTSICNASSRRAAAASRVAVEPKLDIARYHMIGPSINLMNFSAVTIFLARVVVLAQSSKSNCGKSDEKSMTDFESDGQCLFRQAWAVSDTGKATGQLQIKFQYTKAYSLREGVRHQETLHVHSSAASETETEKSGIVDGSGRYREGDRPAQRRRGKHDQNRRFLHTSPLEWAIVVEASWPTCGTRSGPRSRRKSRNSWCLFVRDHCNFGLQLKRWRDPRDRWPRSWCYIVAEQLDENPNLAFISRAQVKVEVSVVSNGANSVDFVRIPTTRTILVRSPVCLPGRRRLASKAGEGLQGDREWTSLATKWFADRAITKNKTKSDLLPQTNSSCCYHGGEKTPGAARSGAEKAERFASGPATPRPGGGGASERCVASGPATPRPGGGGASERREPGPSTAGHAAGIDRKLTSENNFER